MQYAPIYRAYLHKYIPFPSLQAIPVHVRFKYVVIIIFFSKYKLLLPKYELWLMTLLLPELRLKF